MTSLDLVASIVALVGILTAVAVAWTVWLKTLARQGRLEMRFIRWGVINLVLALLLSATGNILIGCITHSLTMRLLNWATASVALWTAWKNAQRLPRKPR